MQIKNKTILLTILVSFVLLVTTKVNSQPGYPDDGFYIYFNTDFLDFPDTLHSDLEKTEYLNENLKIIFTDSTKSIKNDSSLIELCCDKILKTETRRRYTVINELINKDDSLINKNQIYVDTINVAFIKIQIRPLEDQYLFGKSCYGDRYVITDLSLSSQSKGTIYWYTGKLIFIYNGTIKEFFIKNIPDGCNLDLGDIKLNQPNESIVFPPFLGKYEIIELDLNEYKK